MKLANGWETAEPIIAYRTHHREVIRPLCDVGEGALAEFQRKVVILDSQKGIHTETVFRCRRHAPAALGEHNPCRHKDHQH